MKGIEVGELKEIKSFILLEKKERRVWEGMRKLLSPSQTPCVRHFPPLLIFLPSRKISKKEERQRRKKEGEERCKREGERRGRRGGRRGRGRSGCEERK